MLPGHRRPRRLDHRLPIFCVFGWEHNRQRHDHRDSVAKWWYSCARRNHHFRQLFDFHVPLHLSRDSNSRCFRSSRRIFGEMEGAQSSGCSVEHYWLSFRIFIGGNRLRCSTLGGFGDRDYLFVCLYLDHHGIDNGAEENASPNHGGAVHCRHGATGWIIDIVHSVYLDLYRLLYRRVYVQGIEWRGWM